MLRRLRVLVDKIVIPLGRRLASVGITPNMVTIAGAIVIAGACAIFLAGRLFLGAWVLLAGCALDLVDGGIARSAGLASKRGAFIDSTTDRISDALVFGTLAWILRGDPLAQGLAIGCLVLGSLVSYVKARAEGLGYTCEVGIAERPERMTLVVAGLVFDFLVPMLGVLVVMSFVTVIHRMIHVLAQTKQRPG